MPRSVLIVLLVVAVAAAIGIATARAVGGESEEQSSEAPTILPRDVPVRLSPATVELDGEAEQVFRETWSRQSGGPRGFDTTPAPETAIKAHGRTSFGSGLWWITTYRNVDGLFCYGERLGYGAQGLGCIDADELFSDGPLFVSSGRRQANDPTQWNVFWIYGFTESPVESIQIVSTDCSLKDVSLDSDGVFLQLVGPAEIDAGVWPHRVVGRDASGATVAEKPLRIQAPDTPDARRAGVKAPRPQNCE
jgi:hypothetical protein